MRCRARVLVAVAALGAAGCAQSFDATRLGVPVEMAAAAGDSVAGQRFSITKRSVHAAWGIVRLSQPSLDQVLAGQLVGGRGVRDLRIRVRSTFFDGLLTVVTAGLVVPRAITYEGVITGAPVPPVVDAAPQPAASPPLPR